MNLVEQIKEFYQIANSYELDEFSIYGCLLERRNVGFQNDLVKFIHFHDDIKFSFHASYQNQIIRFELKNPSSVDFNAKVAEEISQSKNSVKSSKINFREKIYNEHFDSNIDNITLNQLINKAKSLSEIFKKSPFSFGQILVEKQTEYRVFICSKNNILCFEKKNMYFYLSTFLVTKNTEDISISISEVINQESEEEVSIARIIQKINSYETLILSQSDINLEPTEIVINGDIMSKLLKLAYPKLINILYKQKDMLSESITIISNPHLSYGNTGGYFSNEGELFDVRTLVDRGKVIVRNHIKDKESFLREWKNPGNLVVVTDEVQAIEKDNPYLVIFDISNVHIKITNSLDFFVTSQALLMLNKECINTYYNLQVEGNLISLLQQVQGIDLNTDLYFNFPDKFSIGSPSIVLKKGFVFNKERLSIL